MTVEERWWRETLISGVLFNSRADSPSTVPLRDIRLHISEMEGVLLPVSRVTDFLRKIGATEAPRGASGTAWTLPGLKAAREAWCLHRPPEAWSNASDWTREIKVWERDLLGRR
jgi:hypothetical protein